MAFVGISKNFTERVGQKIHNMQKAEINALGKQPEITALNTEPWVLQAVWGEHLHLLDKMPEKWLGKAANLKFRFKIDNPDLPEDRQNYAFGIEFADPVFVPPNHSWYGETPIDESIPQIAPIVEYATKFREIDARWFKVRGQVISFLESCKSANEAVKLWPDVKMYFDQEDIERLEAKTIRSGTAESEAAKKLAELDTNGLTSAAVIARMSGAQV
jgi:hypothetical protein